MPEKKEKPQFIFDPTRPILYKVERLPNGFSIFREGFIDAQILVEDFTIGVSVKNSGGHYNIAQRAPLLNFSALKEAVTDEVVKTWVLARKNKLMAEGKPERSCNVGKKLKEWFKAKIVKSIGFYLYPEWKNLVGTIDPNISAVYKKFFVVRGPKVQIPKILQCPEVLNNKGLVNDLLTYNSIHLCLDKSVLENGEPVFRFEYEGDETRGVKNWRLAFSDTEKTYKALNLTLDQWPRGVPVGMAARLNKLHLSEPITDRVKLIAVLMANDHNHWRENVVNHSACIMRSTPEQIRKAFYLFQKNYKKKHKVKKAPFSLRGHSGIRHMINHICDYDQPHEGEILGLLEKSHRWHQDADLRRAAQAEIERIRWEAGREERERLNALNAAERAAAEAAERLKPTKAPPIPLPENKSIKFLDTAEKVFQEGEEMGHCIASYARPAIKGECFLFHIDRDDEKASIMINKEGRVVQSYGPRNCINKASEWATRELAGWGQELAKELKKNEVLETAIGN